MKSRFVLGAASALLTMTAIPVWASCHDTSSVREPDEAVQTESSADMDVASKDADGGHLRAEEVPVENLDEHQAIEGDEDPAPEGYTTNVPPEKIEDDADVGETTPVTTEDEAEARNDEIAAEAREGDAETKAMKTSVDETGEYTEESPEEEQAAMAKVEENAEKVKEMTENTVPGEGGEREASTGGAEPTENWFGCSPDADGSEGETCEPSENETSAETAGHSASEREYAEIEPAKREVELDVDCADEPGIDGTNKG